MVDIILTNITREVCGGAFFIFYIAGGVYLELAQQEQKVRFIDFISNKHSSTEFLQVSADVCCYPVFFANKVTAFHHMQEARRKENPPRLIIVFGPFVADFPEQILTRGLADVVVHGDPEFVIPALLREDNNSLWVNIPNLSYMHQGEIVHTLKNFLHDLNALSFVSPFLYSQGISHHPEDNQMNGPKPAYMVTTRGCLRHCVFCDRNAMWGKGIRHHSIDNILHGIKVLVETYSVKEIRFYDDDFTANQKYLVRICQGIRDMEMKFNWTCSACVDSVNKKILLLMARSGCREIHFGVESVSPQVLRRIGKTYGYREIFKAIQWSKEVGLNVEVMITTGNQGETEKDSEVTLAIMKKMGVKAFVNRVTILPGTPLFYKGLREGLYTKESFFEEEGFMFYEKKKGI